MACRRGTALTGAGGAEGDDADRSLAESKVVAAVFASWACQSGPLTPANQFGGLEADAPNWVWWRTSSSTPPPVAGAIKLVSIIDEHTRECLTNLIDRSVTGDVLINELHRLIAHIEIPSDARRDQREGSEIRDMPDAALIGSTMEAGALA